MFLDSDKYTIQKFQHFYYTCIFKLFGLTFLNSSYKNAESCLKKFGLYSFEYRVFSRLGSFINKIMAIVDSPSGLRELLTLKIENHKYNLRTTEKYTIPKSNNHYGDATFVHFFSRFVNLLYPESILFSPKNFKVFASNNIDANFNIFLNKFELLTLKFNVSKQNTFN